MWYFSVTVYLHVNTVFAVNIVHIFLNILLFLLSTLVSSCFRLLFSQANFIYTVGLANAD